MCESGPPSRFSFFCSHHCQPISNGRAHSAEMADAPRLPHLIMHRWPLHTFKVSPHSTVSTLPCPCLLQPREELPGAIVLCKPWKD